MSKNNTILFIMVIVVILVLLLKNLYNNDKYYYSPVEPNTVSYDEQEFNIDKHFDLPTDPIEFAKQLQAELEEKYPGGDNGYHSPEQFNMARKDIYKAYNNKDCLLKLGNVCFKPLFDLNYESDYITYQDCLRNANLYGIKYCYYEKDRWAWLAEQCGGTQNLATMEELQMLSDYLYDIKSEDCSKYSNEQYSNCTYKFREGFPRKENNDLVQEHFLLNHPFLPTSGEESNNWKNDSYFIIPSGKEKDGYMVYGWHFGKNGTNYTADIYRSIDRVKGMCISRD